ncbi:unnamed protein product [Ectocarpus sp. 8 AP-2014]
MDMETPPPTPLRKAPAPLLAPYMPSLTSASGAAAAASPSPETGPAPSRVGGGRRNYAVRAGAVWLSSATSYKDGVAGGGISTRKQKVATCPREKGRFVRWASVFLPISYFKPPEEAVEATEAAEEGPQKAIEAAQGHHLGGGGQGGLAGEQHHVSQAGALTADSVHPDIGWGGSGSMRGGVGGVGGIGDGGGTGGGGPLGMMHFDGVDSSVCGDGAEFNAVDDSRSSSRWEHRNQHQRQPQQQQQPQSRQQQGKRQRQQQQQQLRRQAQLMEERESAADDGVSSWHSGSVDDPDSMTVRGGGTVRIDDVEHYTLESTRTMLITQFDSSPATYSAEDAGVRLHVRLGSMAEEQVAGPIVIETDKRLLVECGGSWFLVAAVVDCQPSGSIFDVPLDLEFRVEEGLDELSDDSSEDANLDEYVDECKEIIRKTYKVLRREQSGEPWNSLSDEETTVVEENGVFFMRAQFKHFTEGCLAKNLLLDNAVQTEVVRLGRPRKKQLEFINATNKTLTFLVLPTTWSNKDIKSLALSVGVAEIGEAKASIEWLIEQAVLTEAVAPQVLQIPPMNRQGTPKAGERCTSDYCDLPNSGGSEARVALVTVENETVSVWFSRNVRERTRLMVLPGQFSAGMNPQLGKHPLPQDSRCIVRNTFTATGGEPMSIVNAPVSTVSSTGSGSTSAEEMDEGGE